MNSTYIVKERDTLTKIAGKFGLTVPQLVAANGIKNPELIRKDQILVIPPKKQRPIPALALAAQAEDQPEKTLSVQVKCAAGRPISNLKLAVELGCERIEYSTDSNGEIPTVAIGDATKEVQIFAEKSSGGWKKISTVAVSNEETTVTLRSPKTEVTSKTAIHEGPVQTTKTDKPAPTQPGTVEDKRSAQGNPVQVVALECPNKDNLRLDANFKYREIILAASKRSGICPQAIAAIMNAEAATIRTVEKVPVIDRKTKTQKIGKDGKPKFITKDRSNGEWDANSASPNSSARGMTQFVDGSWIDQATISGTYLNARAVKEGWITETTLTQKIGKKVKTKSVKAFRLANGNLVTGSAKRTLAQTLNTREYFRDRAVAKDSNLQSLMDLRFQPDFAIQTAVDYGVQNLAGLAERGIRTSHLSDAEKAKMIYLTHHLGLDDAIAFIKRRMTAARAEELLIAQLKEDGAKKAAEKLGGDYLAAHREWLQRYVDSRIQLNEKMCNAAAYVAPRDLVAITDSL
ncbi:LysM peptidoglycan-binding domain-containing protein [Pseudoduganella sp. DS3]|uniref:LysM peptidoglycan-binding domain-containing protein n=1 Tax=Pseudoduganella guangdongensis TaxID=2692179 RepID=A0A6N9HLH3_9BURK|nr:LysM domain-containing protein [Pseudoduganella guangdongensis]MYN04511.1 LysM peptidoglycan-binding domain-containing protein [Pseudoduganella guangdongensis]